VSELSIDSLRSRHITQSYELNLPIRHSTAIALGAQLREGLWIQKEHSWRVQVHICYRVLFFYSIIHCIVINTFSRIKAALEIDIVQGREPDQSTHDKVLI
jgi:hypothetical protein